MKKYSKENIQTVLKMAWPSVLESFFVALVGMVDSLMVSRVGAHAVAAVGPVSYTHLHYPFRLSRGGHPAGKGIPGGPGAF